MKVKHNRCAICGTNEDLVRHHLIYDMFLGRVVPTKYLQTLCRSCHRKLHSKTNCHPRRQGLTMTLPSRRPYRAYIPCELINKGFVGDVDIIAHGFVATMLKPGISLEEARESVKAVIQDLGRRKE